MSERALLERFDLVAENPENIPLLRRYIVDLAIRGKLLEPTHLDISASEMLKRIGAKADSLVKEGKIKKQKPLAPISSDEIPVTYAAHCTFERLGNIANLQKGLTGIQSSIPGEFPLVVTAAARSTCDHYDYDGAAAIVPMVSSTGHGNASLNRLHYQEGKFALGTILCAAFPIDEELISARFLFEYLTAFKDELLVSQMNGTANVTLTVGKIAAVPVPIIAPAVQRRVDELMVLCDQLEAAKNEREARRDRLVAASLHRIGTAPAAADEAATEAQSATPLRDAARFHLDHLPRLTTRPEHIKQLRQTILNLAVRGRLVPQDPKEEPAAVLLKRIQAEKARLIKEGKLKKPAMVSAAGFEVPFDLPCSWAWVCLGDVAQYGLPDKVDSSNDFAADTWVLDLEDIEKDTSRLIERVPSSARPFRSTKTIFKRGDVLFGKLRPYLNKVLVADQDGVCTTEIIPIRGYCGMAPEYIKLVLKSPLTMERVDRLMYGMKMPRLGTGDAVALSFPLPPLAEQHHIVAMADELMALCDQLEAQLTANQTDSRRLLEAVLHDALAPAMEKAA